VTPRTILFLGAGALLLAVLSLAAFWTRREPVPNPSIGTGPAAVRARSYGVAREQLQVASDRRDRLRRQVAELRQAQTDLAGKLAPPPEAGTKPAAESEAPSFTTLISRVGKLYISDRIGQLKTRLNLTPAQEERLRELFAREMDEALESDPASATEKARDLKLRAALLGILDRSQMAEYDRMESEDKERAAAQRVDGMVASLTVDLDLQSAQVKSLRQILKADPTLVHDDQTDLAASFQDLEGGAERLEQSHRRLAALLQPQLTGDQLVRMEAHFKESEKQQRDMIGYLRLFSEEAKDAPK